MKIVCDSCGTKYSIADEKVRGKVFKIRCKKCSHIIVVRGGESAPETAAPAAEGGWHLVIDGEQVGPIADSDVRIKIERGEVKGDTYTWKEGFADWVKLSVVPEFAGLVAEDVAGANVGGGGGGGDLFTAGAAAAASANGADHARRSSGAGRSLFGGGGASDVFAAPATSARSGGGDLFGSAATAPAEESRWPGSAAAAAGHDGGRVESLTGQRHENSVLFSLSNLQSLAMPASKPAATAASGAPTTEGSGLIDIRAMAASTLGTSGGPSPSFGGFGGGSSSASDDLPAFGAFSPAAPVLLPLSSRSGPPAWVYVIIALFAIAIAGIGLAAYKVLSAKSPVLVEQVQQIPAPQEPAKAAPAAAEPGAKPTTIAEENLPPRAGSSETKAGDKGGKSDKGEHEHHHGKGKESGKKGDDKKGSIVAAAAAASEPAEKKPPKGSLDDLIDGATNSHRSGSGHAKVSDDDGKAAASAGPLSKGAVVAGMNSVKPKVAACYNEFKVPGMAMVAVAIGKSGKVTSATVSGKFAGTPTGACVEKAVKSASFPPSDGLQTPYPFQLK
jgi:predicted Zn finger-like uncharacterized protein